MKYNQERFTEKLMGALAVLSLISATTTLVTVAQWVSHKATEKVLRERVTQLEGELEREREARSEAEAKGQETALEL